MQVEKVAEEIQVEVTKDLPVCDAVMETLYFEGEGEVQYSSPEGEKENWGEVQPQIELEPPIQDGGEELINIQTTAEADVTAQLIEANAQVEAIAQILKEEEQVEEIKVALEEPVSILKESQPIQQPPLIIEQVLSEPVVVVMTPEVIQEIIEFEYPKE